MSPAIQSPRRISRVHLASARLALCLTALAALPTLAWAEDAPASAEADAPLPVKSAAERTPIGGGKPGKLGRLGHQSDMDIGDADDGEEREGTLVMQRWTLQPRALLMTQAALLTGEDNQQVRGDRMERTGFSLRRARLGFAGTYGQTTTFGVFADLAGLLAASGNSSMLSEAWVAMKPWQSGTVIVGAHRTPYSKSSMVSSAQLAMAERAHGAIAMAPFRQVGVTVSGNYDLAGLEWHAGLYNAFERGANFYSGVREFSGLQGNTLGAPGGAPALLGVARVSAAPLGDMGVDVADSQHGDLRLEVGVNAYYNNGGSTTSTGMGADIHAKIKGVHVLLEWLSDASAPKDKPSSTTLIPADVGRQALIAEAGYQHKRFLVAARAEILDPNQEIDDDQDELLLSGSVGYTTPGNRVRLLLQYDHRQERNGVAVDNDTLFAHMQLML